MSLQHITEEEFQSRRRKACEAAKANNLEGLLVCSRGGGTLDRYADVLYLANFYTPFPYIPELPGHWSGRAHAFLLLPVEGEPILIADIATPPDVSLPAGQIRVVADVIDAVAEAVREIGLDRSQLGLVGADVLPVSSHERLCEMLPSIAFEDSQALLDRLRAVKSTAEINNLEQASFVGSRTLDAMMEAATPGKLHGEVVASGMQVLMPRSGMLYNSFMSSGKGGSSPKKVGTAFPTWGARDPLEEGDWFKVGLSGAVEGYVFDLARSRSIGKPQDEQTQLFEAAIEVVEASISAIRPGVTAHDVASAGLSAQETMGYEIKSNFSGMGHGIGLGWDAPWLTVGNEQEIEENMVLCVERTIYSHGFVGDFEETVVVTEDGSRKLTDAVIRRW